MDRLDRQILEKDFEEIINKRSLENESNTPDFVLASYLVDCLENFNNTIRWRESLSENRTEKRDY